MYANYHTHTARCHHAEGADEEYVKMAIAEGVKVLGFSDHAPMPFEGEYVSYYKMLPSELEGYVDSVLSLREKYKNEIQIHLGLEVEYYPSNWDKCLELWKRYPIEYLLLGQHFVGEETDSPRDPSIVASPDGARLTRYVDRIITAIGTGRITYIAHPDLLNYTGGDLSFYRSEMQRLVSAAKARNMPLEYNLLGMSENRCYPREDFWRIVAELGATAIIGCDAHAPYRVANPGELALSRDFLNRVGVEVVERVELTKPF